MTDLIKAENNLPTNLEQLTVEIKFYVNQWGQNTIEIGKRLIAAKKIVAHGDWSKWLEDNFQLKKSSAANFMKCAERFGNFQTSGNLNSSQMVELLALPAEETEKFIAEKAAEGNPVEDMTVKKLRAEVAAKNEELSKKKSEVEDLFSQVKQAQKEKSDIQEDFGRLQAKFKASEDLTHKYHIERDELQRQLENQKPQVVEKIIEKFPDDYAETKSELTNALSKVDDLQTQLDKAIKNVEKLKKTTERLERKQYTLQEKLPADACKLFQADIRDGLPQISDESVDFIITDPPYSREYIPLYGELSKVAARVLKDGGSLVCMVGQSYLPEIVAELSKSMNYHWCMCYLTFGASPQLWQKRTNTFWKPLLWFVKGKYTGDWNGNDVMQSTGNDKKFHQWGQSIGGMKDIVERLTNPNDVVLDPFLGGGTTGVTAILSGRKFIGADIEQKCLDTTLERVKESYGSSERKNGLA